MFCVHTLIRSSASYSDGFDLYYRSSRQAVSSHKYQWKDWSVLNIAYTRQAFNFAIWLHKKRNIKFGAYVALDFLFWRPCDAVVSIGWQNHVRRELEFTDDTCQKIKRRQPCVHAYSIRHLTMMFTTMLSIRASDNFWGIFGTRIISGSVLDNITDCCPWMLIQATYLTFTLFVSSLLAYAFASFLTISTKRKATLYAWLIHNNHISSSFIRARIEFSSLDYGFLCPDRPFKLLQVWHKIPPPRLIVLLLVFSC